MAPMPNTRFWTDSWLPQGAICNFAQHLYRAISRHRQRDTMQESLHNRRWARDITGAPTASVLCDYVRVSEAVEGIQLNQLEADRFVWRWTANGEYSASSAYRSFFIGMTSLRGAKEVWGAAVPPKVKFFFWLALHGRLWTAERRRRHAPWPSGSGKLRAVRPG
jgi:hypothetical protein